jgi:hypothetical protein
MKSEGRMAIFVDSFCSGLRKITRKLELMSSDSWLGTLAFLGEVEVSSLVFSTDCC